MKARYYIKQLTEDGVMVDPEWDGSSPFSINGYATEAEAESDLEITLKGEAYPFAFMEYVIVKVYEKALDR